MTHHPRAKLAHLDLFRPPKAQYFHCLPRRTKIAVNSCNSAQIRRNATRPHTHVTSTSVVTIMRQPSFRSTAMFASPARWLLPRKSVASCGLSSGRLLRSNMGTGHPSIVIAQDYHRGPIALALLDDLCVSKELAHYGAWEPE